MKELPISAFKFCFTPERKHEVENPLEEIIEVREC